MHELPSVLHTVAKEKGDLPVLVSKRSLRNISESPCYRNRVLENYFRTTELPVL